MKLNSKGMTLIELIVSVALISVVLLFMYRLMADIEYDSENEYFASQNQQQRLEIIDFIYENIRGENITNVKAESVDGSVTGNITISLNSGNFNINVQEKTLTIQVTKSGRTTKRSWNMQNAYLDPKVECSESNASPQATFYDCNIKVYTDNMNNMVLPGNGNGEINNNNRLDDISFIVMKKTT